jgi:hypothetical protein
MPERDELLHVDRNGLVIMMFKALYYYKKLG